MVNVDIISQGIRTVQASTIIKVNIAVKNIPTESHVVITINEALVIS
jgi:hypothetical protein